MQQTNIFFQLYSEHNLFPRFRLSEQTHVVIMDGIIYAMYVVNRFFLHNTLGTFTLLLYKVPRNVQNITTMDIKCIDLELSHILVYLIIWKQGEPPSNQLDFGGTLGSDRIPNLLKLAKVPRKSVDIWIFFGGSPIKITEENRVPRTTLLYFIVQN